MITLSQGMEWPGLWGPLWVPYDQSKPFSLTTPHELTRQQILTLIQVKFVGPWIDESATQPTSFDDNNLYLTTIFFHIINSREDLPNLPL